MKLALGGVRGVGLGRVCDGSASGELVAGGRWRKTTGEGGAAWGPVRGDRCRRGAAC